MTAACVHCQTPLPDGSHFCPTCGADTSDPGSGPRTATSSADLLEGLREAVGEQYEMQELLGRGGMGAVFLAVDRKLERQVAIKLLPPDLARDEQFVGRFEHEARTAAKLDHPGIIPIYAVESEGDLHFFVMKFVSGRSLESVIEAGAMPLDLTQRILWEAACALGHAHSRGVVHRDIKPANIMLDENGRVLLTDFGISKALQSASKFTATGQVIGTPHFMSPEQAKGAEVGGASDQYSLAVVGYRMLTGRLPFEDDSVHTIIYKHVFEDPTPTGEVRPETPEFLQTAIRRAMAKEPSHRFPTMEDFATAVWPENPVEAASRDSAQVLGRRSVSSTEAPTEISEPTTVLKPPKRRVGLWAAMLLVLLAGSGAAFALLTSQGDQLLTRLGLREAPPPTTEPPLAALDTVTTPEPAPRETDPPAGPDTVQAQETQQPTPRPRTPPRQVQIPPTPAAPEVGYLTISATPWGTLYLDGVEIRDTPVVRHALSPGQHILEIRREGYRTVVDTIMISAGNESRLNKILTAEGQ